MPLLVSEAEMEPKAKFNFLVELTFHLISGFRNIEADMQSCSREIALATTRNGMGLCRYM